MTPSTVFTNLGTAVNPAESHSDYRRKSRDTQDMTILPRLVAIAMKKYCALPGERDAAVRMLLRNAVRLAVLHLGKDIAEDLARETFLERAR